jgi:hypothetical protein
MKLQGGEYIEFGGGVAHISFSGEGQLHLGNKYIFVSMHHYCGPEFYYDRAMTKQYVFTENCEDDPIWPVFEKWHIKYMEMAKKAGKYWAQDDYLNGDTR